jgi:predicted Zn-dependent protease
MNHNAMSMGPKGKTGTSYREVQRGGERAAVQKGPTNSVFQYRLGMARMVAGHLDSAERSLQRALKNNPNAPYAATARVALEKISKRVH